MTIVLFPIIPFTHSILSLVGFGDRLQIVLLLLLSVVTSIIVRIPSRVCILSLVVVSIGVGIGVVKGRKDGMIIEIHGRDIVSIIELVEELFVRMIFLRIPELIHISHIILAVMGHQAEHISMLGMGDWGHVMVAYSGWVRKLTFIDVLIYDIFGGLGRCDKHQS